MLQNCIRGHGSAVVDMPDIFQFDIRCLAGLVDAVEHAVCRIIRRAVYFLHQGSVGFGIGKYDIGESAAYIRADQQH